MKLFRNLTIGFSAAAIFVSFAVLSSAEWGNEKMCSASSAKTLRDSAAALQKTNPDLANQLTELADQHEKMLAKKQAWRADKIKMAKDSAVALQASNPDLAKGLNDYADRASKKMEGKEKAETYKHDAADVKLFKDSAAALQAVNPELAEKLTTCATKKEMKAKWMEEKGEGTEEPADEQEDEEMS